MPTAFCDFLIEFNSEAQREMKYNQMNNLKKMSLWLIILIFWKQFRIIFPEPDIYWMDEWMQFLEGYDTKDRNE